MTTAEAPTTEKSGRLVAIDALRGIAALAVLVCHLPFSTNTTRTIPGTAVAASSAAFPEWVGNVMDHGRAGVHLFLILSGFCIHQSAARRGSTSTGFTSFWRRRLFRLYPPYLITLILTVAGLYVLHAIAGPTHGDGIAASLGYASTTQLAIDLVVLLFLLQNLTGASQRIGNGPFWTLALEEQLYILYFPLLWLRRRGWTHALVVAACVTIGWRVIGVVVFDKIPLWWLVVGPARWFEWVLGALAVEAHLGLVRLPRFCHSPVIGLGLLALAIFLNTPSMRAQPAVWPFMDVSFGVAFFVLVNFVCRSRWETHWSARILGAVGMFSYSLYLTHEPVLVASKHAALRLGLGVGGVTVTRIVVPIIAAYAFYWLVERRFINASRATKTSSVAYPPPATAR